MKKSIFGYVVRVANSTGDYWIGQRVYRNYVDAITVKRNLIESGCYSEVYIRVATMEQFNNALSVVGEW